MRFDEAVAALDARTNYERTGRLTSPTLERIDALMDVMAHPERSYPVVHVTGTNGKTTVARAASEVLRAAGLRVGTYTSPHVSSVRERFAYDGAPISREGFVDAWEELAPYLDLVDGKSERPVTWFEAATALAFSWFAEKAVDVAVIEVGLGGTWDATNVADAQVAAIARVGLDHTEVLGPTLADIAREKAGVIKPGALVYTAAQASEVEDQLRARCLEIGAEIRPEGGTFALEQASPGLGGQQLALRLGVDHYEALLPMLGEHFARDALLGAAAARGFLGEPAFEEPLISGAFSRIRVLGRMEVVRRQPLVVLDGAHNPEAAETLARALRASFSWDRLVVVTSVMADKDVRGVLAPLVVLANEVIVTRNASPRAATLERMADEVRALGAEALAVQNVRDAISVAIERAGEQDCVIVTGSLYTVGEARSKLVARSPGER